MRLLNINSIPKKSGNSAKRRKSFSKSYIRKIWLYLAIFDLIIMYVIYLRVINFFGIKLLCDRYIMDTLIDFKLNFPRKILKDGGLGNFYYSLLLNLSTILFLQFLLVNL